jgi:hypothetical protein
MSKSAKSNPEKGLRTVSIDFAGQTRTLKFSHPIVGNFEAEANGILHAIKATPEDQFLFADRLIGGWLGQAKILSCALRHAMNNELPQAGIDSGIDDYIQSGGQKIDLIRAIMRAYYMATDPSSLALLERSWKASDEFQAIQDKAATEQTEIMEKKIAAAKAKIDGSDMKELPS